MWSSDLLVDGGEEVEVVRDRGAADEESELRSWCFSRMYSVVIETILLTSRAREKNKTRQ